MSIIQPHDIQMAIQALGKGDVVAIPTETVYGLAGRIDKPEALEKIFKIKDRPFFDPLIVHVESSFQAKSLTSDWNEMAEFLAKSFWPGPLTLVLPKASGVNSLITSGLDTVGIRSPRHPIALSLLRSVDAPLAAPSANKFGKTSPTEAAHVEKEFSDILILDGGPCEVGIESTVLKIEREDQHYKLFILRRGLVTQNSLEDKLKSTSLKFSFEKAVDLTASPGHTEHHYMPPIPLIYCSQSGWDITRLKKHLQQKNLFYGMDLKIGVLDLPAEANLAARKLYSEMRRLSEMDHKALVFFHRPEQKSEAWQAILDRLFRAAKIKI